MFRLYRPLERNEFFVVFGDTAQGGSDSNFVVFMSKTRGDIPLVMQKQGMATEMVPHIRQALHYVHGKTQVKPMVALERNNGGASAMHDLMLSNVEGHYDCYYAFDKHGDRSDKLGWDTNNNAQDMGTRPKMLGEWLVAFNAKLITIYDKTIIEQHQTFIVNRHGKPEAAPNTHDDAVMACAGAWQLYQTENALVELYEEHDEPAYDFMLT